MRKFLQFITETRGYRPLVIMTWRFSLTGKTIVIFFILVVVVFHIWVVDPMDHKDPRLDNDSSKH